MSIELGPEWRDFDERLNRAPLLLAIEIHRALQISTLAIEADARRGAPQDTRRLHSSINSRVEGTYPNLIGVVGPSVRYGANVEFGRRAGGKMPPVDALLGWVRRHTPAGSLPRAGQSRDRYLRGRAFALARAIQRRGIRPQPYLQPALNQNRVRVEQAFRRLGLRVVSSLAGQPTR